MGHRHTGPLALVLFVLASGGGCTRQEDAFGQLIVAIDSEVPARNMLNADGEFDRVQVEVSQDNVVLLNRDWNFPLAPLTFPQTVALVNQGDKPSEPLRFVVTATLDGLAAFVQEAKLVVPTDSTAHTVVRLEWLCRGFSRTVASRSQSTCPAGQTCRAGACVPSTAVADDAVTVAPAAACFDLQSCFEGAQDITASLDGTCAFTLSEADAAAAGTLNVALEPFVGQGGVCSDDPTPKCRIGLPKGTRSGFAVADGKLRLPGSVCSLLASGERIARVWLSRSCPSRAPTQPLCSPWLTR